MAAKELVMLDESNKEETKKNIVVVLSDECKLNGNILTIPLNEALSIAANITIQVAILI